MSRRVAAGAVPRLGGLLLATALATVPTTARAQPTGAWEAGIEQSARAFDASPGDWSAWRETAAWIQRRRAGGALRIEATRAERFDVADLGGAADAWLDLGSKAYAEFRIDVAPDAGILPEYAFRGEAYLGALPGWELSAGWRRRGFRDEGVDEAIASVAEYVGRWYLRQRVTALYGAGEDGGLSLELVGRRTLATPRDFVEAGLAIGVEAVVAGPGPLVEAVDRRSAWVRFEAFPWSRVGVSLLGEAAEVDAPLPDRRTISAGLLTRW